MSAAPRTVFVCSCDKTMPLDETALARGCGGAVATADQLCRAQVETFRAALGRGGDITVACTQEAPLFTEIGEEMGAADRLTFVNVREAAGWSDQAAGAGPKMAALVAAAAEPMPGITLVSMESRGVALIYGHDDTALEVARRLADTLDITVLLTRPKDVAPLRRAEFPVLKGTITTAKGHLGAFELGIADFASPLPSSRAAYLFGPARDGATSTCDLVVDVSGGAPLFPAHELRSGYLKADPRDRAAVERLIGEAANLVGEFDKPRFIAFNEGLCAHSRSRKTGCVRCLDLCPTGAISPAGDHVAIDPHVCAGCGSCAAACPTGAASYALPAADALLRKLRTLVMAYREAGGREPVILFHDGDHGADLIDALARFGRGLPANVLPVELNEITQIGPETVAALFAYGVAGVRFLGRAKPKHDMSGVAGVLALSGTVLEALGFGAGLVGTIETDDPDMLRAALDAAPRGVVAPQPATFLPMGAKRGVLELAFRELHRAAPAPVDVVPLAAGAPFGGLGVDVEGCTLCLSCVSACPTNALSDNPERPSLRFTESLCVQCGLCAATCPEKVITLEPRIDFPAWSELRRIIKEEEPFHCIACAKPFGTKSTIERIVAKLEGKHWMFAGEQGRERTRVLMMCEDCRVEVVVNESFDPHASPQRPRPRTADDYRRETESGLDDLN